VIALASIIVGALIGFKYLEEGTIAGAFKAIIKNN
jgi:hypothetical protein